MEEAEGKDPQSLHEEYSFPHPLEDTDSYKDLRLELEMSNYWEQYRSDLEDRVRLYERHLDSSLCLSRPQLGEEQDYVTDLIHEFACLTSTGETNKRECLRKLEAKLKLPGQLGSTDLAPAQEGREGKLNTPHDFEIDEDVVAQIYKGLSKMRETRQLERQKLVSELAFSEPWTNIELVNLLRGIIKYGEHNWSDIYEKCNFQALRTPNSLAYQWSKMKITMLEDIDRVYANRGCLISKADWIQAGIRKLESKDGVLMGMQPGMPQEPGNAGPLNAHRPSAGYWQSHGHASSGLPTDRLRTSRLSLHGRQGSQGEDQKTQLQGDSGRTQGQLQGQVPGPGQMGWRMGNQEGRNSGMITPQELMQDKRQGALQQLQDNYNDCLSRFSEPILKKAFAINDVKQYLLTKEKDIPIPPKPFAVQYAAPPLSTPKSSNPYSLAPPPPPPEARTGTLEELVKTQSLPIGASAERTTPLLVATLKTESEKDGAAAKPQGVCAYPTAAGAPQVLVPNASATGTETMNARESKPSAKTGDREYQGVPLKKMFALRRQDLATGTVSTPSLLCKPTNEVKQNYPPPL